MKIKNLARYFVAGALISASGFAAAEDASFNATITLTQPITLSLVQDLSFAPQVAGSAADVVTAPDDSSAAIFSAAGEPEATAQASVVESSIDMVTGSGASNAEIIQVDAWTYGGNLASNGATAFDASGNLTDMRVGATAHVESDDVSGDYVGTATFRLVYL